MITGAVIQFRSALTQEKPNMKLMTSLSARSSAAIALTMGLTTANLLPLATLNASAQVRPVTIAQSYNNRPAVFNRTIRIAVGAVIPTSYPKAQKIVLAPDEKMATTLTIPSNIRSGDGRLLIPAGSTVEGEFRPASSTNRDGVQRIDDDSGRRRPSGNDGSTAR